MHILLVEDEQPLAASLCKALRQTGFEVDWCADGDQALNAALARDYDALVLDLGLPGKSGHEVLHALRGQDRRMPVLILTARDSLAERVGTLNEGADDFLAKPFALPELEARLTALVRRSRGVAPTVLRCGPLAVNLSTRQYTLAGVRLLLPPRESALLQGLMRLRGEPMSRQRVMASVFATDDDVQPAAVDVLVHRLRKRLEHAGVRIATYRGLGYVLETDEPR